MPDRAMGRLLRSSLVVLSWPWLSACTPPSDPGWSGYVEGEWVRVASPVAGRLERLDVAAGQDVARGAPLFTLDAQPQQAALAEARARVAQAQAQAGDTLQGRRADEQKVVREQLAQARAAAALARRDVERQQQLTRQGFVSSSRLDEARTVQAQADARVQELEAALRVARLPAREGEQLAAASVTDAARNAAQQLAWQLEQKRQASPVEAQVTETYYRQGEYVPAGQPVLALLPPAGRKARFFVPEAQIAAITPGQTVSLGCDACGEAITARVTRIASQAEFTPPVIYSNAQRARLVFMVEAVPLHEADAARLRPGQPIDVRPVASR